MNMPVPHQTWVERVARWVAPRWNLQRVRARIATELVQRHYEAASTGRRTQGWNKSSADAVMATGPYAARLRATARDLVRNNPYAESILTTIVNHTVRYGIQATSTPRSAAVQRVWRSWAETTACDADGLQDFYGLQKLVMRTVVESGEVLVRRRLRRPEDGLPLPLQLQVLEPDYLDTTRDSLGGLQGGRRIVQGVEYDAIGRRVAYWLFREHPGSMFPTTESVRVPAENVLHIFKQGRPGQVRGVSWFADVLLKFKDLDEFEDATLMKQKIAACLAVITSDVDGTGAPLGTTDTSVDPQIDSLEPGMILNVPPGRTIEVVQPPNVRDYADYTQTQQRAIAAGMFVPYEDMSGNYTELPFSAARMSRLSHWDHVDDWRWRMLVPMFCDPVWRWFAETAAIFGTVVGDAEWTAPPAPMIDPVNEGLAYQRNIRAGIMSYSEALRERGYDPTQVIAEIAADFKRLDQAGIILDSDPRQMTQAGQLQGKALPKEPAAAPVADQMEEAARLLRLVGGGR